MAHSLTASRERLFRLAYVVTVAVAMIGWVWAILGGVEWVLGV